MRAGRPWACALFILASLGARAQPGGPVEVTLKYYELTQAGRCEQAWALYSKATQEYARSQVQRPDQRPESYNCLKDSRHERRETRLVRMQGDEAVVAVLMRGRVSRSRYDIPGTMTDWTEEVKLVREEGAWRIDLRPKQPKRKLIENGDVHVTIGPATGVLHQRFEATGTSLVPREALDAVLRDTTAWAALLPSFKAIEPQERTGNVYRARLSFDGAAPIPVTVRVSGRANSGKPGSSSLLWEVEDGIKAPVYMRGEWYLDDNRSGSVRVKLSLYIDPRHWPGSEKLFSADRMVDSLRDLEKAARSRQP